MVSVQGQIDTVARGRLVHRYEYYLDGVEEMFAQLAYTYVDFDSTTRMEWRSIDRSSTTGNKLWLDPFPV